MNPKLDKSKRECIYNPELRLQLQIIDVIVALVFIGLCILALANYHAIKEAITLEIEGYGLAGLLVMSFILEFVPQFINPHLGLLVAIAAGFNIYLSTLVVIIGGITGSLVGFNVGQKYGFQFICAIFNPKTLKKIVEGWNKYGGIFVLVSALTPVPYLPPVFGALGMSRRKFLIWGIIPRIISYCTVGALAALGIGFI
jgi:uncharacterized membrane protein YdjX (TVP38/TMEM64 family)